MIFAAEVKQYLLLLFILSFIKPNRIRLKHFICRQLYSILICQTSNTKLSFRHSLTVKKKKSRFYEILSKIYIQLSPWKRFHHVNVNESIEYNDNSTKKYVFVCVWVLSLRCIM